MILEISRSMACKNTLSLSETENIDYDREIASIIRNWRKNYPEIFRMKMEVEEYEIPEIKRSMENKNIKVTYSNGEVDDFTINEDLDESVLIEALAQLDMLAMEDIYGDINNKDVITNDDKESV